MKVMVPVPPEIMLVASSLSDDNPPLWQAATTYDKGTPISYAGGVYVALVGNTAKYPDREPAVWLYMHPATPPLWLAGTSYKGGDVVCWKQQRYTALKDDNVGYRPDSAGEWWASMGPVNSWAAFDRSINTKSAALEEICFELDFSGCNGISLFGLEAESVHVSILNSTGEVVQETETVLAGLDAASWLQYFLDPVTPREDVVKTDFPVMAYSRLKLQIKAPNAVARVGHVAVGRCKTLGQSQYGMENGISDYSRKTTDSFGNTYLSVGGWAKTARMDLHVATSVYDDIFRTLAKLRATPTVFVGDNADVGLDAFTIWGFVRDFRMVVSGPEMSQCSLEIQGLI